MSVMSSPSLLSASSPGSVFIASEEEMRTRLFDQFNAYWVKAAGEGVPYDMIGTMSVTAAVYGLLAKHGAGVTAEFLDALASDVRSGAFSLPSKPN
jgi:hypothetical protein